MAFGRTDTSAVFLAGDTAGLFATENAGFADFAAVRLDASDGLVTWKYQVKITVKHRTRKVSVFVSLFPSS